MQILSVSLKNIKSHRDRQFNFVSGINVLSGVNGAGKSTVFEAIGYGLFGVDARDFVGNIERFITIGEKKGEISVTFATDDGETYRASRTVGSPAKWLLARENGGTFEVEDHAGISETEARIKELLGLDSGRSLAEQFKLVIGPFQNEFLGPFILKQPTKRQDAFDEILGIDAWRKTFKKTATLQTAVNGKIEVLQAEIGEKQEQVTELPGRQAELKAVLLELKERQEELQVRQSVLKDVSAQAKQFELRKEQLDTLRNDLKQVESSIHSGREYIASQKLLVKQSEDAVALVRKNRAGKEAFEQADKSLKILREQEQQQRTIEKEVTELEKNALRLAESLEHENKEIKHTDQELAAEEKQLAADRKSVAADPALISAAGRLQEVKKSLEAAQAARALLEGKKQNILEGRDKLAESVCPFFQEPCLNISGKEPADVFTSRLEDFEKEEVRLDLKIQEISREVTAAERAGKEIDLLQERAHGLEKMAATLIERRRKNEKRVQKLVTMVAAEKKAREKLLARKKDLDVYAKVQEEIRQAQEKKKQNQQARDDFARNQQAAEALPQHTATLAKYKERLAEHEKKREEVHKNLQHLGDNYKPEMHEQVRIHKEELLSEVAQRREQIDNQGKEQQRLEKEISRLSKIKEHIQARIAERKTLEAREELVRFLRNKIFNNVSAQLSDRFREEISLRADRIYRTISETDEELFWGDGYQIVLRDMQNGTLRERSDDQLSGGQIMSAVVALRLALLQTIGARIAFFDEPTSNLDAGRRENLAHAFRAIDVGREEVTEHWYDQLFLISHDVAFTEVTDQIISLDAIDSDG